MEMKKVFPTKKLKQLENKETELSSKFNLSTWNFFLQKFIDRALQHNSSF
jgi:hypothetical protein